MATETIEFEAEARQLLQLVIHSVYSDKDVFLRELISNASDALDKLRLQSYRDKDLDVETSDLHIELEPAPGGEAETRTLTVRDNGIGMSRDEVTELIGTIAKSGTAEMVHQLRAAQEASTDELIGQFGIGFYASFMVADRVELVTRKAGFAEGVRWSSTGEGSYTLELAGDAPQGTSVTLHLKAEDAEDSLHDYAKSETLRTIVKRYSDFIGWPIRMTPPATEETPEPEPETINSQQALWARPASQVSDEELTEFYRHVSHDWQDPLETMRFSGEGTFEYQGLLFLPSHAPMDLYMRGARRGVQLYVKRVFVMDDCEALVPEYLRFVKGVVDAADLSLNVSREILQQDRQIQIIAKRLVRKVLQTVRAMQEGEPGKYQTFWSQFGTAFKEGLVTDPERTQEILAASSFPSTHSPDEPTTLRAYKERMPEGQEAIYYLTGEARASIENSPHLEAFRAKGYEVLLLTDQVDEVWTDSVTEFEETPLSSASRGEVDLGDEQDTPEGFDELLAWMGTTLGDAVKDVRLSRRLTSSPACLVTDSGDMSPTLEKMYRAMGQEPPAVKRILELNPKHGLVTGLRAAHAERSDDPGVAETASLLHDLALLAEGGELADPASFVGKLSQRLESTL
jgi:molecular chaperone HtpG